MVAFVLCFQACKLCFALSLLFKKDQDMVEVLIIESPDLSKEECTIRTQRDEDYSTDKDRYSSRF
jgi:hypothetical protein